VLPSAVAASSPMLILPSTSAEITTSVKFALPSRITAPTLPANVTDSILALSSIVTAGPALSVDTSGSKAPVISNVSRSVAPEIVRAVTLSAEKDSTPAPTVNEPSNP